MSMTESVCVCEQYGPLMKDVEYAIINEGLDFMTLKCHGKPICVPSMYLTRPSNKQYRAELPTYEDIIEAEEI